MKTFDEYKDGDWVVYKNPSSNWHLMQFQAYKSQYTFNAFRLKYGTREVIADISEISPISEINNILQKEQNVKNANTDIRGDSGLTRSALEIEDLAPIYRIQD